MTDVPEKALSTVYHCWSETLKSLLEFQWQLFDGQYQVGLRVMERTLDPPTAPLVPAAAAPSLAEKLHRLECLAAERVKQGLAPPREIYDVPYRDLIDWGAFPEWARPIDPEIFESCSHEG